MRYFSKIYPSQPFLLSNGKGFKFPIAESGVGLLETENPLLISEFTDAIQKQIGGVSEITQPEFEALKKKAMPQSLNEGFSPSRLVQAKRAADEQARAAARAAERDIKPASTIGLKKADNRISANSGFRPSTIDRPS